MAGHPEDGASIKKVGSRKIKKIPALISQQNYGDHLGVDSAEIDVLEQGAGSMRPGVCRTSPLLPESETSCGLGGLCRAQHSFD
jgi:hypothetical protein